MDEGVDEGVDKGVDKGVGSVGGVWVLAGYLQDVFGVFTGCSQGVFGVFGGHRGGSGRDPSWYCSVSKLDFCSVKIPTGTSLSDHGAYV